MGELPFLEEPLRDHEQVLERARAIGRARGMSRVVVAAAQEDDVLAAMHRCREEGISDAILVGVPDKVNEALDTAGVPRDAFELVPAEDDEDSAKKTADIAASGRADVVMKGYLKTSTLLKTLLKSEHGLRDRELVSHSAVLSVPGYDRLLNVTDGGTLVAPTLEQKMVILANAVRVMRSTGVRTPRVAVIGPSEEVRAEMPETEAAAELVRQARDAWPEGVIVDGPLPLDAVIRGPETLGVQLESSVAGRADVLLVHTLEEGNIIAKSLIQFADAVFMGVIAGARVPISLVSRSDTMMNKMASVALAVCLADFQRRDLPGLPSPTASKEDAR